MSQLRYYNEFAQRYRDDILASPAPEYWTTDEKEQGPIYLQMKERVGAQLTLANTYFKKEHTVLDLGCGFGRQAIALCRQGYFVEGVDSSPYFIEIAIDLLRKCELKAQFHAADILNFRPAKMFRQVVLLDVLEHFNRSERRRLAQGIASLTQPEAILLVSVPATSRSISSRIHNQLIKPFTQLFTLLQLDREHPYPLPGVGEIRRLFNPYFVMDDFQNTADTSFYVFRRQDHPSLH